MAGDFERDGLGAEIDELTKPLLKREWIRGRHFRLPNVLLIMMVDRADHAGIVGALVGGFILGIITGGDEWITGINISTLIAAIVGAVVVVFAWKSLAGRRSTV